MKKKIIQSLSNLDQFGSLPQLTFFNNEAKFKTLQGGIFSILLLSIGSSYFVYLMFMWKTNKIPPIVTNQSVYIQELRTLKLTTNFFVLQMTNDRINQDFIDLQKQGYIYDYGSFADQSQKIYNPNPYEYNCNQSKTQFDYFDPICWNFRDKSQNTLAQNFLNKSQDDPKKIYLVYCDTVINQQCLSQSEQHKIMNIDGKNSINWRLTLFSQDIDLISGEIIDVPKDYEFEAYDYTNNQSYPTSRIFLKVKKAVYIIDDGVFFPNEKYHEVITSIQYEYQQYDQFHVNGIPVQVEINVSLDRSEEVRKVVYPKIGQVLAEFGSIIQVLLLLGTLMNKFNTFWMNIRVEEALLKIYFPNSKIYSFSYNLVGKMKSIQCDGKPLKDGDLQQVKQFRLAQGKQMKTKLNFVNILHELSRLQVNLQLEVPRERIIELQDLGYRAKLPEKFHLETKKGQLDYDDFLLIQKQQEEQIMIEERVLTFGDKLRFQDSVQATSPQNFAMYDLTI